MAKGKKFLSTYLSVAKMHQLYLEKFEPEASVIGPQVTYDFYLNFFNSNFNLSFGVPKTDTCATCDSLDVTIIDTVEKQKLQNEKQAHLMKYQCNNVLIWNYCFYSIVVSLLTISIVIMF